MEKDQRQAMIDAMTMADGNLRRFTQIGSYPIFYMDEMDCVLCPKCAKEDLKSLRGAEVNWESELYCEECSEVIESAYGEPYEEYWEEEDV